MGIRGMDAYLRERKLLTTAPLSALSHSRLGIDASHYLKTLLASPEHREPLVASTGGLPLSLFQSIENDMRALERLMIQPVLVFPGLPLGVRTPARGMDATGHREQSIKTEAWAWYEKGEVERAVGCLTQIRGGAWTDWRDVVKTALRVCKQRRIEFVFAPYLVEAQLSYLEHHPLGHIHATYSSAEALLWPFERVITHIDITASTFTFINKPALLANLQFTADQLLDLSLLAGSNLSRTFPPYSNEFALKQLLDLMRSFKSGIRVCETWHADDVRKKVQYQDAFWRARCAVKYSLIYTTEGACTPLPVAIPPDGQRITVNEVPTGMEEIHSERLPDEVYYHLAKGFVSPQVLGWLSSGIIQEPQPLADSESYQRFVKEILTEGNTSPRCTALALLAGVLHPYWREKKVIANYYFDSPFAAPGNPIPFNDEVVQQQVAKVGKWTVNSKSILDGELRRQGSSTIDLKLCIGAVSWKEFGPICDAQKSTAALDKKDEIVGNVTFRFLEVRGFIDNARSPSVIGKAFHAACESARVNDRFVEPLYIVLELLRAGVLHANKWSGFGEEGLSGGPSFGDEQEMRSVLLIMRVLSIMPLNFRPQQYTGPLSRELLVFNSFIKSLTKSLRHLIEALSINFLLSGQARRNRDDFMEIIFRFPFQNEVNTGGGILAKTYLDATTYHFGETIPLDKAQTDEAKEAKRNALDFVEQSFTGVKAPVQEVERGFRFWDSVVVAMRALSKHQNPQPGQPDNVASPELFEEFEQADQWLKSMRP